MKCQRKKNENVRTYEFGISCHYDLTCFLVVISREHIADRWRIPSWKNPDKPKQKSHLQQNLLQNQHRNDLLGDFLNIIDF